jgi:hypothetical protein
MLRLEGAAVITDATEDLLVGLRRANIIDAAAMVELLSNHLDERKRNRERQAASTTFPFKRSDFEK